jgi:hypothetical protein
MARIALFFALFALVVGCGGDDKKVRSGFSENCDVARPDDCETGLTCISGIGMCSISCNVDTDCAKLGVSKTLTCSENVCYYSCDSNVDCLTGQNCNAGPDICTP